MQYLKWVSAQVTKEVIAMQNLSEYIQDLKKQLKMQENQELAESLNIDEQTILRWCKGEQIPDDDTCIELAYIAKDDPANVLILKHFSSASKKSSEYWEKISIKFRHGRTVPKFMILNERTKFDRRHSDIQVTGTNRRSLHDRRKVLDRRLPLAS